MGIKEVFQHAVKAQINGDRKHGWGVEDSTAVIVALIADNEGIEPSEFDAELRAAIREAVNPSQLRQKLEESKPGKGDGLLDITPRAERKTESLLKGLMD